MLEVRPTGIASHRDTYFIENGGIITSMKKLLFIIPPVLLLLALAHSFSASTMPSGLVLLAWILTCDT